jgi:Fur family ferric uptake transcriptional regulator
LKLNFILTNDGAALKMKHIFKFKLRRIGSLRADMGSRGQYKTRQRDEILAALKSLGTGHVTAGDVYAYLCAAGRPIGRTTVYRQLERLVDEGAVEKYSGGGRHSACFEYVGEGAHAAGGTCYHLKCERCGKLIHLNCDALEVICDHLSAEHGFALDPKRTVFYGLCEACRSQKENGAP